MTIISWIELYVVISLILSLMCIVGARKTDGMELGEFCTAMGFCAIWPIGIPFCTIFFIAGHSSKDWILSDKQIEANKRSGYDT